MRKVELLPIRDCEAGYGPDHVQFSECAWCFTYPVVDFCSIGAICSAISTQVFKMVNHFDDAFISKWNSWSCFTGLMLDLKNSSVILVSQL